MSRNMDKHREGFTLIELVLVVAIIGILTMFALPAYHNYTKRGYVAEALSLMAPIKTQIIEYYVKNDKFSASCLDIPDLKDDFSGSFNRCYGLPASSEFRGKGHDHIMVGADGIIAIVFNEKVQEDAVLGFQPLSDNDGPFKWRCLSMGLDDKYLPTICKD